MGTLAPRLWYGCKCWLAWRVAVLPVSQHNKGMKSRKRYKLPSTSSSTQPLHGNYSHVTINNIQPTAILQRTTTTTQVLQRPRSYQYQIKQQALRTPRGIWPPNLYAACWRNKAMWHQRKGYGCWKRWVKTLQATALYWLCWDCRNKERGH